MRKGLYVTMMMVGAMCSLSACGETSNANKDTSLESDESDEKWVDVPSEALINAALSGSETLQNSIGLNCEEADYYVVNSYNRREIQPTKGVSAIETGSYKVEADFIKYNTALPLLEDNKEDFLTIIAYNEDDKIIGYSLVELTSEGQKVMGNLKYCEISEGASMEKIEAKCNEIFGKSIFNDSLEINTDKLSVEKSNDVFTEEVYKYVDNFQYISQDEECATIDDSKKVKEIFELLAKLELEETECEVNGDESLTFVLSSGCVGSIWIDDENIYIWYNMNNQAYTLSDSDSEIIEQIKNKCS